jgi:hypothetical protein
MQIYKTVFVSKKLSEQDEIQVGISFEFFTAALIIKE